MMVTKVRQKKKHIKQAYQYEAWVDMAKPTQTQNNEK